MVSTCARNISTVMSYICSGFSPVRNARAALQLTMNQFVTLLHSTLSTALTLPLLFSIRNVCATIRLKVMRIARNPHHSMKFALTVTTVVM